MSRKGESITLSLSAEEKEQLEQIAFLYGQTWGDKPNISQLMRAIAKSELKVIWGDEESPVTVKQRGAMKAAIATIQSGLSKLIQLI